MGFQQPCMIRWLRTYPVGFLELAIHRVDHPFVRAAQREHAPLIVGKVQKARQLFTNHLVFRLQGRVSPRGYKDEVT